MLFVFLATRSSTSSSSKRTRRCSKTTTINDRNNEFVFDEEHLIELLKRLKQQPGHASITMTADDESNLFDTLISKLQISSKELTISSRVRVLYLTVITVRQKIIYPS
jgi:hypothetical protein